MLWQVVAPCPTTPMPERVIVDSEYVTITDPGLLDGRYAQEWTFEYKLPTGNDDRPDEAQALQLPGDGCVEEELLHEFLRHIWQEPQPIPPLALTLTRQTLEMFSGGTKSGVDVSRQTAVNGTGAACPRSRCPPSR